MEKILKSATVLILTIIILAIAKAPIIKTTVPWLDKVINYEDKKQNTVSVKQEKPKVEHIKLEQIPRYVNKTNQEKEKITTTIDPVIFDKEPAEPEENKPSIVAEKPEPVKTPETKQGHINLKWARMTQCEKDYKALLKKKTQEEAQEWCENYLSE
jgi:hypothetical protein